MGRATASGCLVSLTLRLDRRLWNDVVEGCLNDWIICAVGSTKGIETLEKSYWDERMSRVLLSVPLLAPSKDAVVSKVDVATVGDMAPEMGDPESAEADVDVEVEDELGYTELDWSPLGTGDTVVLMSVS